MQTQNARGAFLSSDTVWLDYLNGKVTPLRNGWTATHRVGVDLAVVTGLWRRGLAAKHGDVIVEADVTSSVILGKQNVLRGEGL